MITIKEFLSAEKLGKDTIYAVRYNYRERKHRTEKWPVFDCKLYVAYDGTFYVHRFVEGEEHSARCFWSAKEAQNLCRKINREAKIKEEL